MPALRLEQLRQAGELGIPFTTGILLGKLRYKKRGGGVGGWWTGWKTGWGGRDQEKQWERNSIDGRESDDCHEVEVVKEKDGKCRGTVDRQNERKCEGERYS